MKTEETVKTKKAKNKSSQFFMLILCFVLFILVITLTILIFVMSNIINSGSTDKSTESFLSSVDERHESYDIGDYLIPQFIGVSSGGNRYAVNSSEAVIRELYHEVSPIIAYSLTKPGYIAEEGAWDSAIKDGSYVYLKFHSPLPYQVISASAGSMPQFYSLKVNITSLLIVPSDGVIIFGMTDEGEVYSFQKALVSLTNLENLISSYRRSMTKFDFIDYEPVFTEKITTRDMLITAQTGMLLPNLDSDVIYLLRLFDFNPDKLSSHDETDSGIVYVETHGVLRLLSDSIEFSSTQTGGIDISDIIAVESEVSYQLSDYLKATSAMIKRISALNKYYIGGDASIVLTSAYTDDEGNVGFVYSYTFDNIIITDTAPAVTAVYNSGKLVSFSVSTVAVSAVNTQTVSYTESWYYKLASNHVESIDGAKLSDIHLVYRADYSSEKIKAQWGTVYTYAKEADDGT